MFVMEEGLGLKILNRGWTPKIIHQDSPASLNIYNLR
jgi:hypothetical protein